MNKNGIELSMNVIIIAAISLVVLVLLAYLVLNAGKGIGQGTTCEAIGGHCILPEDSCGDYARYDITKRCAKESAEEERTNCCIPTA